MREFPTGLPQLCSGETEAYRSGCASDNDDKGSDLENHAGAAAFQVMTPKQGQSPEQQAEQSGSIHEIRWWNRGGQGGQDRAPPGRPGDPGVISFFRTVYDTLSEL